MMEPTSDIVRLTANPNEVELPGITTILVTGPIEASGQESKEACATCRFYLPNDDEAGECRRYPPNAPSTFELDGESRGLLYSSFPDVSCNEWCGEYERATA